MRIITHWALAFVTVILVTLFHYNNNYIVETAHPTSLDLLQHRDESVHIKYIAIVEIDETTLAEYSNCTFTTIVLAAHNWTLNQTSIAHNT